MVEPTKTPGSSWSSSNGPNAVCVVYLYNPFHPHDNLIRDDSSYACQEHKGTEDEELAHGHMVGKHWGYLQPEPFGPRVCLSSHWGLCVSSHLAYALRVFQV